MSENIDEIILCIEIDDHVIYDTHETINEASIIKSANHIEKLLQEHNAKPGKIRSVYELTVEILQNILAYSYDSRQIEDNKLEANGRFTLSYHSNSDTYKLSSCNLITKGQKELIETKLSQIDGLSTDEIKQLMRQKMRAREDIHERGAGLGFLTMARKSSESIHRKFVSVDNNIMKFKLGLVV
jgi:hypothetical protein